MYPSVLLFCYLILCPPCQLLLQLCGNDEEGRLFPLLAAWPNFYCAVLLHTSFMGNDELAGDGFPPCQRRSVVKQVKPVCSGWWARRLRL